MGLMVGNICIGAPLEGPFVHVVRFAAFGRVLTTGISLTVDAAAGEGRGTAFSFPEAGAPVTVTLSARPISDFLNQDGFEVDDGVLSVESFDPR